MLSVPGRKTGQIRSNPVDIMEIGGRRYLVAPYGETDWVRNARAAGEVTLSRGGRAERFRVEEVDPDEAAPVLRKYLQDVRLVRPSSTSPSTPPKKRSRLKRKDTPSSGWIHPPVSRTR
jgi:deazaflavin-dependent oxidoreductase (nitroreductase family)